MLVRERKRLIAFDEFGRVLSVASSSANHGFGAMVWRYSWDLTNGRDFPVPS